MAPDEFRRLGHTLVDSIAAFLESLPDRPVTTGESPAALRALLDSGRRLPDGGSDPGDLLRGAAELLFDHSLFNGHPRFLGYIPSCPTYPAIMGDWLDVLEAVGEEPDPDDPLVALSNQRRRTAPQRRMGIPPLGLTAPGPTRAPSRKGEAARKRKNKRKIASASRRTNKKKRKK